MRAGSASADITPSVPLNVVGQGHVRNGEYTHDPLTVNAAAFAYEDRRVALVSCDLVLIDDKYTREIQRKCEEACGIPAASVLIGCTHTHTAPAASDILVGDVSPEFIDLLTRSIVYVVGRALNDLEEVDLYAGNGWLEQMGFNRRGYRKDGSAEMYHGCWNEDFSGLEGPRDGQVGVIFARRKNGDLKFIIPSFASHATTLELGCFYSADLVGAVRNHLHKVLGEDVDVIYLNGAAGDISPTNLESRELANWWRDEEGWARSGLYLGSEIVKVITSTPTPMPEPTLRLAQSVLKIPMREYGDIFPKDISDIKEARENWAKLMAKLSPLDVHISVVRLGKAAICTTSGEIYSAIGLAIKKGSPADVTLISEITDGNVGYVPTPDAFAHGGYSAFPATSSMLAEDAAEIITKTAITLLGKAFS